MTAYNRALAALEVEFFQVLWRQILALGSALAQNDGRTLWPKRKAQRANCRPDHKLFFNTATNHG